MSTRRFLGVSLLLFIILLAACRKDEPTPTSPPQTPVIDVAATPESEAAPAFDWPPHVLAVYPAPGEEAPLDGPITVRFDQPMDRASVEESFAVESAAGERQVEGSFSWPEDGTLIFTPAVGLTREQQYEVKIAASAKSRSGQLLAEPVAYQVQTVGFLEVSQTIPEDRARNVQTDAAVTVVFNRPVVPLVSTVEQASLPQPLSFEPAVEGEGQWVSTSVYRFTPAEPLAGATEYRVTVEGGLEDVTGGLLQADYSWSFTTLRPTIVTMVPEPNAVNVHPNRPLTVTFNMPMDRPSTEAALSLNPAAPLDFEWTADGRTVVATPSTLLELDTRYTLTIGEGARSASGGATLDRERRVTFNTVLFPAVDFTEPADGQMAERWQNGTRIVFTSPMDFATLEDQIVIEPAPEDDPDYFWDEYNFNLYVSFPLERNSTYTLTVPGAAADLWGNTIGEDYTWSFTTPPHAPLISLNLPGQISQLSTSRASDVEIIIRNISRLDARLYSLEVAPSQLIYPSLFEYVPPGEPIRTWSIPVSTPLDAADVYTLTLADGGVLSPGIYYLGLSAPEVNIDETFWWQKQRAILVVGDSNLAVKETVEGVYVWATDLATGLPAEGLDLALYDREGRPQGTAVTDAQGLAQFAYEPPERYLAGVVVVANQPGEAGFGAASSAWNEGIYPWQFGLDTRYEAEPEHFAYLYTDRPIYRPGDTMYFKGIVRDANYGRYTLPSLDEVTLSIQDLNYIQPVVELGTFEVNENGEFSGEYAIPADAQLGIYALQFSGKNSAEIDTWETQRNFTIADYRRPEFQVTATADVTETLRGEPVEVVVEAEYFFGGVASDLPVQWTAYEQPFTPDYEGPYYSFTDSGDFFYEPTTPFSFAGEQGVYGRFVTNGQGMTDAAGRFVIQLPADLLDEAEEGSRRVTVEASVLDITEFPIAARAEIIYHAGEIYVGIVPRDYIAVAGTPTGVDLVTVDWDGEPVPNTPVEVVFYEREWEPVRDLEFEMYYTRWEVIDTEVARTTVTTDEDGQATAEFEPERGGMYLAVATVADAAGREQLSSTSLWAADPEFIGWRSDPRERRMDLTADRPDYRPGDTARILVQSPFAGPAQAWLTIERGDVLEQRIIELQGTSDVLEIPITADLAPNVYVSVLVVKGVDETGRFADMRLGVVELVVSAEQQALTVTLTPQQELFEPGDTAVYDLLVTDYQGRPVQASFSLSLVDLAVLTLKPDNAPHIMQAFYARQPIRSQTGSGLIISGEGLPIEIPIEQGGRGGGGGNGLEQVGSVRLDEDEARRNFPDTAHWEAIVSTDADGRARIEITLPDTLTTWRLSSKAVSDYAATGDTLVGQTNTDVVATLPLLIRPVTPRFFTVGDTVELGAAVHNNTSGELEVTTSLEATGLTLVSPAEQTVTVAAGGRQLVRWTVTVDDVTFADLTFQAASGEYRDATKPTFGIAPDQLIPVTRFTGEDVVGTAGVIEEAGRRVEAILLPEQVDVRQGDVQITLQASLAAALTETLADLLPHRFEARCAAEAADRLLPSVAMSRAINELDLDQAALDRELKELIASDISLLESLQLPGGGWGWCYSTEVDPFLSAYALFGLTKAEQAGFPVEPGVLAQGARYVGRSIKDPDQLSQQWEINRQAFFLYVLAEMGEAEAADLDAMFTEHRELLDPYARALLALAYDLTGGDAANRQALLGDLNDSAVASATGARWESEVPDWENLGTDIRSTAIVIDALARLEPDHTLLPGAVRWLMVARNAGHWRTGHEDAWSVFALTDWMIASGELEADYEYKVTLNGRAVMTGQFDDVNVAESVSDAVLVNDLALDDLNYFDFQRGEGTGRLYYSAHLDSYIRAENLPAVNRGIIVQRAYYDAACDPEETTCEPITAIAAGQQVRVELSIIVPNDLLYAVIEDPIPAGAEAIDPGLATTSALGGGQIERVDDEFRYGYWGWWYFNHIEYRDEKVVFYSEFLPAGTYLYSYTLQTVIPGEFQVNPATAREQYFPEVFGRSEGFLFEITE